MMRKTSQFLPQTDQFLLSKYADLAGAKQSADHATPLLAGALRFLETENAERTTSLVGNKIESIIYFQKQKDLIFDTQQGQQNQPQMAKLFWAENSARFRCAALPEALHAGPLHPLQHILVFRAGLVLGQDL